MSDARSPSVSVIIPAYNAADTLKPAVESVLSQTYSDYEILIVDDASCDRTLALAEELARTDGRIRVLANETNRGLAATRNRAIAEMATQWIAPLDADDMWLPEKLAKCMAHLGEHPELRIVYHPMAPVLADGTPMAGHNKPCFAGQLAQKLFYSIFVHDPAVVFHREVIETCGGFDESLPVCVGHEFWLRVAMRYEFGLVDDNLALRRWSERTLTRSNRSRARKIKAGMLERFYYERGGRDLLDPVPAMRRLAKVNYSAGKCLLSEGRFAEAADYLRRALKHRPGYIKCYPYYAAARLAGLFGGKSG